MQDYELDDWLGGFPVTDEQRTALHRAADLIAARYIADDGDAADTAFTAAYQVVAGDNSLNAFTQPWRTARIKERDAMTALTGALIAASLSSNEHALSVATGLNRRTVRKALGK